MDDGDDVPLGDRELDVMGVLWEAGSGTVAEVRDRLRERRPPAALAYTTVLTILRNLERKGAVERVLEGQAHRYAPRVARAAARRSALARLVDKLFHGAPEHLLAHLVADRALGPDALRRLRAQIDGLAADAPAADAPAADALAAGGAPNGSGAPNVSDAPNGPGAVPPRRRGRPPRPGGAR